jgi:hypothetical protein
MIMMNLTAPLIQRAVRGMFGNPYVKRNVGLALLRTSSVSFSASTVLDHNPLDRSNASPTNHNPLNVAHIDMKIPENDYYHGHLLCDQLEYINDAVEKSISEVEQSIDKLEGLHAKKRSMFTTIGWTDTAEIDALFNESAEVKATMKRQLSEMKLLLKDQKNTKSSFAVDAPDGTSDGFFKEEMQEVQHILNDTPTVQEKAAALQALIVQSRGSINGVDAPDGTSDDMNQEELEAINYILNHSKASKVKKSSTN